MPPIMPFEVVPKFVVDGQFPCISSEYGSVFVSVEGALTVEDREVDDTVAEDSE